MTAEPGAVENALLDLGLSAGAARLYPMLLDRVPLADTADDRAALAELVAAGLAVESDGQAVVTDPVPSLRVLADRKLAEADRAATALTASYQRLVQGRGDDGVRLLPWLAANDELRAALAGAESTVALLDALPLGRAEEKISAEPGVDVRVVHSAEALRVRREQGAEPVGATARLVAALPVKLVVVDGTTAFLTAVGAGPEVGPTALVRSGPVLTAVGALFEAQWRSAIPLVAEGPVHIGDRRLLSLLDAGLHDDAVCQALGIGKRTLYRRLEVLMARTGATNRFQLAAHAARSGWI